MNDPVREVVDRVGEIARKTAIQLSPLIEVTVLSRNPDGSLNVDDGRGGCTRIAPRANVRIGQKIKLGTEPSVGGQTQLPQLTFSIDTAFAKPCPHDPRLPDPPSLLPDAEATILLEGSSQNVYVIVRSFANRNNPSLPLCTITGTPGAIDCHSAIGNPGARTESSWLYTNKAGLGNEQYYALSRTFFTFDTTNPLPAGATLVQATLRLSRAGVGTTNVRSDDDIALVVCPGLQDFNPILSDEFPEVELRELGRIRMLDIPNTYAAPFLLGISDLTVINLSGLTRLALLTEQDLEGTPTPAGALVPGTSRTNFVINIPSQALGSGYTPQLILGYTLP